VGLFCQFNTKERAGQGAAGIPADFVTTFALLSPARTGMLG